MIGFLTKKSTLFISGSVLLMLIFGAFVFEFFMLDLEGPGRFAYQFCMTKKQSLVMLAAWGGLGKDLYFDLMWIDYLLPLTLAIFLTGLMLYFVKDQLKQCQGVLWVCLFLLPLLYLFFSLVENAYLLVQVRRAAELADWVFVMATLVTLLKWTFLVLSMAGVVWLWRWKRCLEIG